jgi:hypothetical protein
MKQAITVVALVLVLVALFSGCNRAEKSADAEAQELLRKIEALKKEKQEAASLRDVGLDAELAAVREQLQIALAALEKEGEILIKDAPRAVVVEEGDEIELGRKLNGPLALEPVALLDAKDHQIFFAELGKFGDWFETDSYGFVWQPAELKSNPAWRPYTRGRWVNSDQGWTWLSDEPFGWAVYHYGRWVLLVDHGWVWVPGDDWAPAWVAWRQNDSYLGWAPLPPETLYDDFYDYDSGIDLAYDIAPDYYNFVPVDYFFEPLLPYCVPRATVVTIIINTRNVTRFSMRDHRVHCGGPDLAWVNHHTGRNVRPCRVDFGGGADRFAHRGHHRLHNGRLEVFAPQVDAPWNAAVCPSRVSGYLGKVEVVRSGKGKMDRALVQRHQRAAVQRHQSARDAMKTEVCQVALRQNIERQRAGQDRGRGRPPRGEGQRLRVAEENLRAAGEAVATAERRLEEPNMNPKQQSYVRRAAAQGHEELAAARATHTASLPEDRAGEVVRNEGRRDPAPQTPRGPRATGDEPRGERSRRGPERVVVESGQSGAPAATERGKEEAAELAAQQERERTAQAERARMATERRREEEKRARKREEILTAARAEEEAAKGRAKAESLSAKQRATAQRAARDAERRRKEAEEAAAEELRQQEIAAQKRDVEEEKEREAAERALLAEKQRRVAEERAKREASTRAGEQNRRAQEARAARVEADKKEERRQQIAERAQAQSKAEATRRAQEAQKAAAEEQSRAAAAERRRQAIDAQRQAEARKQAEEGQAQRQADARRQALAQKRAEESQRQAAMEAKRRAVTERAQADAKRRAATERAQADVQRRAAAERAQADAQRRAAAERAQGDAQRRAQAESQRRAAAESARRQQEFQRRTAAAQARAEAARRQQKAARKQQVEQSHKQSQQPRGRKR